MSDENMIPAGNYTCKAVRGWEWKEMGTGTLGFQIPFAITHFVGERKIVTTMVATLYFPVDKPDTCRRSKEALQYLGWNSSVPMEELHDNNGGLSTNEVSVVIEHENVQEKDTNTGKYVDKYEDEKRTIKVKRPKIAWINRGVGFGKPAAKADVAAHMAAVRKAMSRSNGGKSGETHAPAASPAEEIPAGIGGDDEIPF